MQDGIYKRLPMSPAWRRFARSCARPAERGRAARENLEFAVAQEAEREFSPALRRGLKALAEKSGSFLPGLSPFPDVQSARDLGGRGTAFEEKFVRNFLWHSNQGLPAAEAVSLAVEDTLGSLARNGVRQHEEFCVAEVGQQAKPILDAAEKAKAEITFRKLAECLLRDEKIKARRPLKPIDLDEDLTRPTP